MTAPAIAAAPARKNYMSIASIEARFRAGTITMQDIQHLITEVKYRPTIQETIALLKEAGEEFDRLTSEEAAATQWDAHEGRR